MESFSTKDKANRKEIFISSGGIKFSENLWPILPLLKQEELPKKHFSPKESLIL
jgi:hypothetical protein